MKGLIVGVIGLLVLLLLLDGVYTVKQTERAILLRFGAVQEADVAPGLHFKLPIAESVKKTEARVLTLDTSPESYFTLEKKPVIVDSYAKWRVKDVIKYYQASSFDEARAEGLLQQRVNEGLRNQISRRVMREVVSGSRDEFMEEITKKLDEVMQAEFGVEVIDVRVKRIDLPPEASTAVYERMNSERQILARQFRATGRERALGIRADADRQAVVIAANAYKEAEQTRGDGDARATDIYAGTFGKDPEFYEFYRTLNAYSNVFQDKSDLLVLDPGSPFLRYLGNRDEE